MADLSARPEARRSTFRADSEGGCMLPVIIGLLMRHALTAGGGAAVAAGYVAADDATAIAGALSTLAGLVWSAWQKYRAAGSPGA